MLGRVTREKVCQPLAPKHERRFFLLAPLRLHERDQLARDERKGDEDGGEHDAGDGEDDLDIVLVEPGSEPPLSAEHQHVDQAGNDGRDRERQIDQGDQKLLAAEVELGDCPRRGNAEEHIERHGDACRE